jgi:predicted ABC-type transport system involved in lysophospholipase L1 biosynthesis ATPase subunit
MYFLSLARALANRPRIIFADEPTALSIPKGLAS